MGNNAGLIKNATSRVAAEVFKTAQTCLDATGDTSFSPFVGATMMT